MERIYLLARKNEIALIYAIEKISDSLVCISSTLTYIHQDMVKKEDIEELRKSISLAIYGER